MRVIDSEEAKIMDEYTINKIGIDSLILMENAAISVLKNILPNHNSFIIICGIGNNGGDGLAIGRHLFQKGKDITIYIIGETDKLTKESRVNYNILKKLGLDIREINTTEDINFLDKEIISKDAVIDAIFGIGLKREVEGIFKETIESINKYSKYTYSIDVPSGLSCDSGEALGKAVFADKTITLSLYKIGFLNYNAFNYTGEVIVEDISIPNIVKEMFHKGRFITDREWIKRNWIKRKTTSHKGDFGSALIFAGSKGFAGASIIASTASLRSGAGLTTLITKEEVFSNLVGLPPEIMTLSFEREDKIKKLLENAKGIGFGPGIGWDIESENILKLINENAKCPIVIDADGINIIKANPHILERGNCILTPHPKEFERLIGIKKEEINKNRINLAEKYAKENNVILLLKGYNTVITDGRTTFVNTTGNSAMASGGMGDALTGIITALLAQGYNPLNAAIIGAYIHGYAGDKLGKKMFVVNATHVIEEITFIMKEI